MSNKFEHNVKTKVDGFELEPSAMVWDDIEKNLPQKEKKRRVIFWWLIPALFLVGGVFYWWDNHEDKSTVDSKKLVDNKHSEITKVVEGKTTDNTQVSTNSESKTTSNSTEEKLNKPADKVVYNQNWVNLKKTKVSENNKAAEVEVFKNNKESKQDKLSNKTVVQLNNTNLNTSTKMLDKVEKEDKVTSDNQKLLPANLEQQKPVKEEKADSLVNNLIKQKLTTQTPIASNAKPKTSINKKPKWSYYIGFGNNINTDHISILSNTSEEKAYASNQSGTTFIPPLGAGAGAPTPTTALLVALPQTGFTINAGISNSKMINKIQQLQTNLGIRYRNGKNFVGTDSVVNDSWFFTTGTTTYVNNLWQLEVGLHLNTIINPKSKNQFFIIAGLNTQATLSSNWLTVRSNINKYEANKSNTRFLLINSSFGLGYKWSNDINLQLQVHQSLNSITTNGEKNYFRNIELRTSIPFKSKK